MSQDSQFPPSIEMPGDIALLDETRSALTDSRITYLGKWFHLSNVDVSPPDEVESYLNAVDTVAATFHPDYSHNELIAVVDFISDQQGQRMEPIHDKFGSYFD